MPFFNNLSNIPFIINNTSSIAFVDDSPNNIVTSDVLIVNSPFNDINTGSIVSTVIFNNQPFEEN